MRYRTACIVVPLLSISSTSCAQFPWQRPLKRDATEIERIVGPIGQREPSRDLLFFHHEGNRALRMGNWKLVSAREDQNAWELFDLAKDRCEQSDLAAQHPDVVRRMEAKWIELETEYRRCATE